MEIVKPKVELWNYSTGDFIKHIARCARVCYAAHDNRNTVNLVAALWSNNHRSMFRHAPVYYKIPTKLDLPYRAFIDCDTKLVNNVWYVSTNRQTSREYFDKYQKYEISSSDAEKDPMFIKYKLIRYTFCVETGIDITRELNRKSPNAISEQSTRYVDFNKKLGIRFKECHWMSNLNAWKRFIVKTMCKTTEWFYKISRSKYGLNLPPQDARWILPLDIMSKCVYTYSVNEWERIINLRLFDWTGAAHKDAKAVASKIKELLEEKGYIIKNYKEENEHRGAFI